MNKDFRNDPFYGFTYSADDYKRCEDCNEMSMDCKVVEDDWWYCEGCYENNLSKCDGCGDVCHQRVEIEYDDAPYEDFKSEHYHERLCAGCSDYVTSNPLEYINVIIKGIV